MCPIGAGANTTGPTLMFKGIWQGDYDVDPKVLSALSPYDYRLATIHATESPFYGGQLRFSTKPGDGDYNSDLTEHMIITNTGKVGIGTMTPGYALEVSGAVLGGTAHTTTYINSGGLYQLHGGVDTCAKFNNTVWVAGSYLVVSSDRRIKTNIVDVPDNLALEQLRNIPCRYYEYIDKIRGQDKTIGFIAQEVKEVMPMCVSQEKSIIPDVYKVINCIWSSEEDKFIMSSTDLTNVNGIKYKFYVSNASDGSDEKEIEIKGNSDNTFTFEEEYNNVFCYGKEVDDFNILDKQKLFTLNFSATQEIDRIQQTHISEIETLKTEVSTLKQENMQHKIEIETLKSENIELKEKLTELTNKIKNSTTFEDLKNSL